MRYDEKIRFVCKRFRYSVFNKDEMRTFYKSRCSRTSKVILPGTLLTDLHVKRSNKRKKFLLKIQTYKKFRKHADFFLADVLSIQTSNLLFKVSLEIFQNFGRQIWTHFVIDSFFDAVSEDLVIALM